MSLDGAFAERPLESALYGLSIASARCGTLEEVSFVTQEARRRGIQLLVVRCAAEELGIAQALERAGGKLCDTLLRLRLDGPCAIITEHESERQVVREAVATDLAAIERIAARAFHAYAGHWHADDRLSGAASDLLYVNWARDCVLSGDAASAVFVADDFASSRLAGFLAIKASGDGRSWSVPITAIDPDFRGAGLLRRIIGFAIRTLTTNATAISLDYETQLVNVQAQRSVLRLGFRPVSATYTFHYWVPDCMQQ